MKGAAASASGPAARPAPCRATAGRAEPGEREYGSWRFHQAWLIDATTLTPTCLRDLSAALLAQARGVLQHLSGPPVGAALGDRRAHPAHAARLLLGTHLERFPQRAGR